MSDGILITPEEVTNVAESIKAHATVINNSVEQVDQAIKSIIPARFEGRSADEINQRYHATRDKVFNFKPFLDSFANNLIDIANRFITSDRV